jgi:hypothetical protein
MDIKFANWAKSIIADVGGIGAGDTTLNVDSGDGDALFPEITTGEYFYCVLVDSSGNREVVKVTARSSDALTIVRAQEGTTARVFAQNDKVQLRFTAGSIDDMVDGIISDLALYGAIFEQYTCIAAFGQSSAPTGWTRKSDWQDNAMLCYAASGNISSGGAANPQSAHTHGAGDIQVRIGVFDGSVVTLYTAAGAALSFFTGYNSGAPTGAGFNYTRLSYTTSQNLYSHPSNQTGDTDGNSIPYFQEVIAAAKD